MKNKTNKKIVKKLKLFAKGAKKETGLLMKKAEKESGKMVKAFKKEWKKEEPQREKYKEEIKKATKKAGVKGLELLNEGLKNSVKIGGDVADVIRKDVNEIRNRNKNNR